MKHQNSALLSSGLALLLSAVDAASQGTFQNLDFEAANLAEYSPGSYGPAVPTYDGLPGWSAYSSTGGQTSQDNWVWYDALPPIGPGISVIDSKWPSLTPIQGNYSVLLVGGGGIGWEGMSSTISQTGLVPNDTMSLQVKMSRSSVAPVVTFGGQTISMLPLTTFPTYTLYGGDISSFAGQVATLSITEAAPAHGLPYPSYLFLDDIRLVTIPEIGIALTSSNKLQLYWPVSIWNFIVEQSHDLALTNWTILTNTPTMIATTNVISIPQPTQPTFYRLVSQ